MTILKKFIYCFGLVISICIGLCPIGFTQGDLRESEEFAVYNALLASLYPDADSSLLVMIKGFTEPISPSDLSLRDYVTGSTRNVSGLSQSTIEDFLQVNSQTHIIPNRFHVSFRIATFSKAEEEDIFKPDGKSWDRFSERFPDSPGLHALSGVGLNPGQDQALVSIQALVNVNPDQKFEISLKTGYYFFVKEAGVWKIRQYISNMVE